MLGISWSNPRLHSQASPWPAAATELSELPAPPALPTRHKAVLDFLLHLKIYAQLMHDGRHIPAGWRRSTCWHRPTPRRRRQGHAAKVQAGSMQARVPRGSCALSAAKGEAASAGGMDAHKRGHASDIWQRLAPFRRVRRSACPSPVSDRNLVLARLPPPFSFRLRQKLGRDVLRDVKHLCSGKGEGWSGW